MVPFFASEIPPNLPVWDKKSTQGRYRIHGHIDTSINPPSNCPLAVPNCTVNCSIGLFRKLASGCITHLHVYPSLLASFACKSYNSAILVFVTLFQVVSFCGRFYSGFAGESNLAQHFRPVRLFSVQMPESSFWVNLQGFTRVIVKLRRVIASVIYYHWASWWFMWRGPVFSTGLGNSFYLIANASTDGNVEC